MFGNRVLRKIGLFGPKTDEATWQWRRHLDLYYLPNIIRVIKNNQIDGPCRKCGRKERRVQGLGGEILKERDNLERLSIDGRIILKQIFKK